MTGRIKKYSYSETPKAVWVGRLYDISTLFGLFNVEMFFYLFIILEYLDQLWIYT